MFSGTRLHLATGTAVLPAGLNRANKLGTFFSFKKGAPEFFWPAAVRCRCCCCRQCKRAPARGQAHATSKKVAARSVAFRHFFNFFQFLYPVWWINWFFYQCESRSNKKVWITWGNFCEWTGRSVSGKWPRPLQRPVWDGNNEWIQNQLTKKYILSQTFQDHSVHNKRIKFFAAFKVFWTAN